MDQARIDDHLNSNIEPNMYEELCNELKIYTDLSGNYSFLMIDRRLDATVNNINS